MKSGKTTPKVLLQIGILVLVCCSIVSYKKFENGYSENGMTPTELRCEYRTNPLAIDVNNPRLSWALESSQRGQKQTAYRIQVANCEKKLRLNEGNLWDSGVVKSSETIHIVYDGAPLKSGRCCFWKVKVWDKEGKESAWSQTAFWEMALLSPDDWKGEWINDGKLPPLRDEEFYKDDPAPLFRKEFKVEKRINRARLYISGLGYYEARFNGRRIGDHILDPGWTNYRKRVFYSTYDVTDHLQKGTNCIGVMLGNGWYNPLPLRMWGRLNLREHLPTGRLRFIVQLNIDFTDGTTKSIKTDRNWKAHAGPIIRNNIYLGEIYDARKEIKGWDRPGCDESTWHQAGFASEPLGPLQAQPQPPVKITAILKPAKITEPKPGVYIFDFNQNFTGWVRLRLKAPAGNELKLRYGELLHEDGTLNPMTSVCGQIKGKKRDGKNIGGPGSPEIAFQSDTFIASGRGKEIYTPRFTFHGFRYVEVTGYPGKPKLNSLEGLRLNSAVDEVGSFECSNELLNRIQEMTRWTFLSNILSVQSDCPHRERFAYGGDLAVTIDAFMLNFDMATFYAKAVHDWHDAAFSDGLLTDTAPYVGIQYCGVGWAMIHPQLLYQLYQYYGNLRLLEEQYKTAKRWLDLVFSQSNGHIVQEGLSDHEGLEPAPAAQMVTPLYYQSVRLMTKLASIIGHEKDAERYTALANDIKEAYVRNFLEPGTGKFAPYTQASQSFALYLNLVPSEEQAAALDFLLNTILATHKGHLSTGIYGTKFLLDVLSRFGQTEVAYALVNQKSFPGWGYMIENNATTLWEHWALSENTYSHNHPMFGSVSEWFYKWLTGIQPHPKAVGFNRTIIRPQKVHDLKWVKAHYNSIRGKIVSEWRSENGRFRLNISLPANTTATVYIPAESASTVTESGKPAGSAECVRFLKMERGVVVYEIGSGTYSFTSK